MGKKVTVSFEVTYEIVVADKGDIQDVAADVGNVLEYQTVSAIRDTLGERLEGCECSGVIEVSVETEEVEEEDFDEDDDE